MNMKMLGAFAAVAMLAACATPPAETASTGAATETIVPGSQQDFEKNVGNRVFFDLNKSNLKPEAQATLSKQADWLKQYMQNNVQVAGNCDERGTEEYNIALGQRRANADRDFLVAKGVAASRVTTISYGKDRPIAMGSDESAWAQNRNATTTVR
jgi:peptidoglycan-associated lipoprotein